MTLETTDAFALLEHYDVHVIRSEFVDSPEAAVAFASRRTAKDARFVPIVLRSLGPEPAALEHGVRAAPGEHEIRAAYAALLAKLGATSARILAQESVPEGTDIALEGHIDQKTKQKSLALHGAREKAERVLPFDQAGAEALVNELRSFHRKAESEKERRMIEHMLLRVAALFEDENVVALQLDPIRIHENVYTVLDAKIAVHRAPHLKERLAHHAHDAKEYGFRPSGPQ